MSKGQTQTLIIITIFIFAVGAIVNFVPIAVGNQTGIDFLSNITGLPKDDLFFPNFIWMFLVPLLGSTAMVLTVINYVTGFMTTDRNLNIIIALSWMGVVFATPARYVIWGLFLLLGIYGVGIYAFIFAISAYFLARHVRRHPLSFMVGQTEKNIGDLTKESIRLGQEYIKVFPKDKRKAAEIEKKRRDLLALIKEEEERARVEAT